MLAAPQFQLVQNLIQANKARVVVGLLNYFQKILSLYTAIQKKQK